MKKLWLAIGTLVFWCTWPALWVYLRGSRRTRLLLICGDEFLVLRGWLGSGEWSLPGGGLHKGEESVAGLLREVKEETGLSLTKDQIIFLRNGTYAGFGFQFSYDCYAAELSEKPIIRLQRGEIVDQAWQPLKNPNIPLGRDAHEALEQWHNKR